MKRLSNLRTLLPGILTSTSVFLAPLFVIVANFASLASLAGFAAVTVTPQAAQACRDCPFPMRIGDNRWLMPDQSFVITILEKDIGNSRYSVVVRLTDPVTGRILASGGTQRRRDQHTVVVPMRDRLGGRVTGKIRFVDPAHTKIQVKFECNSGYDCLE